MMPIPSVPTWMEAQGLHSRPHQVQLVPTMRPLSEETEDEILERMHLHKPDLEEDIVLTFAPVNVLKGSIRVRSIELFVPEIVLEEEGEL